MTNTDLTTVIIINGQGGSGKDTFCLYVKKHLSIPTQIISTIDPIKEMALQYGWDGTKDKTGRKLLSDLKDTWTRYNNLSYRYATEYIQSLSQQTKGCLFIHCREPKEIENLCWYCDGFNNIQYLTILINRKIKKYGNKADDGVYDYNYDITIDNTSTKKSLEQKAEKFIDDYIGVEYKI